MVQITGTLTIKTITGRFGDFNVGNLECELGEFAIRDALLEEYTEGTYQGTFGVTRIYAGSYQARQRIIIEARAELSAIWLDDYQEGPLPEPESLEAEPQSSTQPDSEVVPKVASNHDESSTHAHLAEVFGELWPLGEHVGDIVKLAPEVGRERMTQQLAFLKREVDGERRWRFEPRAQHWTRIRQDEVPLLWP
ncbi:hypothetical protein GCM10007938_39650 [Vibrio zhanjiangensis]|uniref:DUF3275 family protein n=1 Tax=Vibrio zhanjiangensis TaxID=1046128 RepID=A0ABQ6F3U2_9VIBR|nr:DUF3275 family protein [Vibrio zhanjiangensis]GLT20182.1 hypothetical protein GCM10007938_39650 [Vibrio zhanjiangensis]